MSNPQSEWDITVEQLKALREGEEDFLLVDVREPHELERATTLGFHLVDDSLRGRSLAWWFSCDGRENIIALVHIAAPVHLCKVKVGLCKRPIHIENDAAQQRAHRRGTGRTRSHR